MKEDFKWTDTLILEYAENYLREVNENVLKFKKGDYTIVFTMPSDFIQSKQSKKDWEIIKETTDCTTTPYTKKITSVKRLSDGEVFAVGDKFTFENFNNITLTIDRFDKDWIDCVFTKQRPTIRYTLKTAKKIIEKQPLFTTTDGVDIYEGDNYLAIDPDTSYGWEIIYCRCGSTKPKHHATFSTKEVVEEYILINKPCLSVNDVTAEFGWNHTSLDYAEHGISKLKQLAKQKIQNNHE